MPSSDGQALQGPLEVAMTDSGWSIVDGKGFRASVAGRDSIDLALLPDDADGVLPITTGSATATRAYRGTLRLVSRHDLDVLDRKGKRTPSRAFDIINHIALEQYLPGVLAGELFAGWRLETFAAQAIAARSFACTEAAIFAGRRHYDLANTTASQMYLGAVAHAKAHEAVQATRGIVLAYENLLVSGYYSSCCGGVAATAVDAIAGDGRGGANPVNSVAPLRGRSGSDVCTEAPVYAWTTEQPFEQLMQRLAGFGRERKLKTLESMQRLVSIDIAATNAHGRPTRITITGIGASARAAANLGSATQASEEEVRVELSAEDFRRAANFSSDGSSAGAGGGRTGGTGGIAIKPPEKELRSSNIRASIVGSTVIFQGHGFGHGVGLCQYGAEALAKSGTAHEDILRWYYPDVEIVRAYA